MKIITLVIQVGTDTKAKKLQRLLKPLESDKDVGCYVKSMVNQIRETVSDTSIGGAPER